MTKQSKYYLQISKRGFKIQRSSITFLMEFNLTMRMYFQEFDLQEKKKISLKLLLNGKIKTTSLQICHPWKFFGVDLIERLLLAMESFVESFSTLSESNFTINI